MASAKKTIIVTQTGSVTAQKKGMKETLIGLGLGKPHRTRELEDTPAIRGMIEKVKHLVSVEGEASLVGHKPKVAEAVKAAPSKKPAEKAKKGS